MFSDILLVAITSSYMETQVKLLKHLDTQIVQRSQFCLVTTGNLLLKRERVRSILISIQNLEDINNYFLSLNSSVNVIVTISQGLFVKIVGEESTLFTINLANI